MKLNFNVQVKGGPRTDPEVTCCYTAVKEREMVFPNGQSITNTDIAERIAEELTKALRKIAAPIGLTEDSDG